MAGMRKLKGKWYIRIYLGGGKEKLLPTRTGDRKLAEAYKRKIEEKEFMVRAKLAAVLDYDGEMLSEAISHFLCDVRLRLRPGTHKSYRQALADMQKSVGEIDVRQIRPTHLSSLGHYLSTRLSPTTVNIRLRAVRAFLNWLVTTERIPKLPGKIPFIKLDDPMPKFFAPGEMEAIFDHTTNEKMKATFQLLAETGLRRSELFQCTLEESYLHLHHTKGRRDRLVPLNPELIPLFLLATDHPYQPDSISNAFRTAMELAGIEKRGRTLHSLRHTYALREYYRTGDIYFVKQQLGHSNVTVTEKYLRFPQEYLRQVFGEAVERQSAAEVLSRQMLSSAAPSFNA